MKPELKAKNRGTPTLCVICGEMAWDGLVFDLLLDKRHVLWICPECVAAGPEAVAGGLRRRATGCRKEADDLDAMAEQIASVWPDEKEVEDLKKGATEWKPSGVLTIRSARLH